ncbi:unnamed protein product [Chironomus riparius]|uniref:Helicase C-terminal domain-containing protein n=1 Tax=Chironomus riparius TaxID=315576 RepID=A0A9N9SAL7_9DIPT|nr:unnamed protein product [Chironomus riparius]
MSFRSPRIHIIIEFPELKLENLFAVLRRIKERDGKIFRTVILTAGDRTAKLLAYEIYKLGIRVTSVDGKRKQKRVLRASDGFNNGKFEVMIVSESGVEVETRDIKHFINYDMNLPSSLSLFKQTLKRRRFG